MMGKSTPVPIAKLNAALLALRRLQGRTRDADPGPPKIIRPACAKRRSHD